MKTGPVKQASGVAGEVLVFDLGSTCFIVICYTTLCVCVCVCVCVWFAMRVFYFAIKIFIKILSRITI